MTIVWIVGISNTGRNFEYSDFLRLESARSILYGGYSMQVLLPKCLTEVAFSNAKKSSLADLYREFEGTFGISNSHCENRIRQKLFYRINKNGIRVLAETVMFCNSECKNDWFHFSLFESTSTTTF